jgi:hypothetical protein
MVLLGFARLVVLEGFLDRGTALAAGDPQGEARTGSSRQRSALLMRLSREWLNLPRMPFCGAAACGWPSHPACRGRALVSACRAARGGRSHYVPTHGGRPGPGFVTHNRMSVVYSAPKMTGL